MSNGTTTTPPVVPTISTPIPAPAAADIDNFILFIRKVRDETASWTALKSKRFSLTVFTVIFLCFWGTVAIQQNGFIGALLFIAAALCVCVYTWGQAKVDAQMYVSWQYRNVAPPTLGEN